MVVLWRCLFLVNISKDTWMDLCKWHSQLHKSEHNRNSSMTVCIHCHTHKSPVQHIFHSCSPWNISADSFRSSPFHIQQYKYILHYDRIHWRIRLCSAVLLLAKGAAESLCQTLQRHRLAHFLSDARNKRKRLINETISRFTCQKNATFHSNYHYKGPEDRKTSKRLHCFTRSNYILD